MDIICMGEMLIDFTPGREARSYVCNPGGAPANACIAIARNGLKTGFLGRLGKDDFGKLLKETLEQNEVEVLLPELTDEAVTTLAFVTLYEGGERSFTFVRKPGADILLNRADISEERIKEARMLHCGSFGMSANPSRDAHFYAMELAKKNGKLVSYDVNYRNMIWSFEEAKAVIDRVFPYVDLLKVSDEELDFVGGEEHIPELMREYGISVVIETLGSNGAKYFYDGKSGTVAGHKVKAVDATGAGDAFWGGFLAKLLMRGVSSTSDLSEALIREALVYGNASGGLCVQRMGGIPALPDKEEIERFIIDSYIDSKREEMLEDLKTLVRINSQKGQAEEGKPFGAGPAAAIAAAQELMQKYGLITRNYDNYAVAGDLSEAPKGLDILAHLDVVPATQDWTVTQPFEPKIVDGRIYGRGTADDKGPAIAALYALRAIRELEIPMKKSVRLVLGSDEECGSSDLAYYYGIESEAPFTFTPDADFPVINIEKGRMEGTFEADFSDNCELPRVLCLRSGDKANVVPQRAMLLVEGLEEAPLRTAMDETARETGVCFSAVSERPGVFRVEARGQAAHASTPQDGKNALTAVIRLVSRLPLAPSEGQQALCALDKLLPYEDTCGKTIGIFREEEKSGAVTLCFSILEYTPKHLHGTFDARLPIGCTEENTKEPVAKAFAEYGIRLMDRPMIKPHCVPGDSDFVKTLLESYERYTGIKGSPVSTGGGTYVHNLERGVAFGCMTPDIDNHMHGDDEFMVIDTLVMSAKIFADAVIRICNK